MREVMKGFFTVLKGCDPHIRFLLLTGVSKFSKAGVFSNLNHLKDISLEDEFCDLLGIKEEELEKYFKEYIVTLGEKEKLSYDETLAKIREWYNGYQFSPEGVKVYNPFSTLLLMKHKTFEYHWFETGTPEFLINLILKNNYNISEIPMKTTTLKFSTYEVEDLSITPLLFQTGYLTIKHYDPVRRLYTLDYPNFEVRHAFLNFLTKKVAYKEFSESILYDIIDSLAQDDIEECINLLRKIFLQINCNLHILNERYYQTIFYLIFTLLGLKVEAEVMTNIGRIDAVVEGKYTYLNLS